MDKEARIRQEYQRLAKLYEGLPPNKRELTDGLLTNAAFMAATLEELQETINRDGAVITAQGGNGFESIKEHPAQKSYNVMIGRYNNVLKTLDDLLPPVAAESKLAAILNG